MQVKPSGGRCTHLMDVARSSQGAVTPGRVSHEGREYGAYSACHTFMSLVASRDNLTALDQQLTLKKKKKKFSNA